MDTVFKGYFKRLYLKMVKRPNGPKIVYHTVVLLMLLFIISRFCSGQVAVYTTRAEQPLTYTEVAEVEKEVIEESQTPIGMKTTYRWRQEEPINPMDCLVFYVIDQYAEVYIEDELLYQNSLKNRGDIGHTPGSTWVVVPLAKEDVGKEIRVHTIPVYEQASKQDIDFFVGAKFMAYHVQMTKDSLQILTSMGAIIIGSFFIAIFFYFDKRGRNKQELMYSGIFFLTIGCWKITEIPFVVMLFGTYTAAISYFSLGMLAIGSISVIFSISHYFSKKTHIIVEYTTLFQSSMVLIMLYLQISNRVDFRESLVLTHLGIVMIVLTLLIASIIEVRKEAGSKKIKTLKKIQYFILICGVTAGVDMMRYYIQGNSIRAIFIIVTFLFCLINMDALSIKKLRQKANLDQHTGLFNKSCCNERLDEEMGKQNHLALIMFDVNDLKKVNDKLGHEQGDVLIRDFAKIIRKQIHKSDFVGRYGGDEFIAIIKSADTYYLDELTQRINQSVNQYNEENSVSNGFEMSYSSGYALSGRAQVQTLRQLLQEADSQMYANKRQYKRKMQEKNNRQETKGYTEGIKGVY